MNMSQEIVWTRSQQTNALNALTIVEANPSSTDPRANEAAAAAALKNLVPGAKTDREFLEVPPDIITGLVNVASVILDHFSEHSGVPVEQLLSNLTEGLRDVPVTEG
jgi:hypothetical protein